MIAIYKKEISLFFGSLIGQLIIGVFLIINNLILWSDFSEFNILNNSYANMDVFFNIAPILFLFLIPAISMKTFSEEYNIGTIENIITKPIPIYQVILGKYFSVLTIVFLAIFLTFISVISLYFLGEELGNLDLPAIFGSYLGLFLLSTVYTSVSIFASSLTNNQIFSFIFGLLLSTFLFYGFSFVGSIEYLTPINFILQQFGLSFHYDVISNGVLRLTDFIYFFSMNFLIIYLCQVVIFNKNK